MSTKCSMTRDINGYNAFGLLPTYDIQSAVLAQNAAQSITVPSNYPQWLAIFSYTPGASVWVSFTTTAVFPTGAFSSTQSVLNPAGRQVAKGTTISFITDDDFSPMVSVEFQIIPPYQN